MLPITLNLYLKIPGTRYHIQQNGEYGATFQFQPVRIHQTLALLARSFFISQNKKVHGNRVDKNNIFFLLFPTKQN